MSGYAGDLFIRIRPDSTGFTAGLNSNLRGQEAGLAASGQRIGRSVGLGILGGFAAVGIAGGLAHQISEGIADIGRVQASTKAVRQEFGSASDAVIKFSETAVSEFGVTEHATLALDARLGVLLKNLGIGPEKASAMAVGLETVAASIAKIRGLDPADVFQALPLALAGNLRSLKQLGFAFDQNQIKQEAVRLGLIRTVKGGINPAIKAQAIYGLVTAHLGEIQVQAAAHSNDLVFQQHRLTAEWDHAREQLAVGLLPSLTSTTKELADNLPGALRVTREGFHLFGEAVRPVASLVGGLQNLIGGLLLLKVASVVKGWAAAHLLESAAVTTETGAVVANTVAVEVNTVANAADAASLGAVGLSAAAASGGVARLAGGLSGLSKIGRIVIPILIATEIIGPEKNLLKKLGIDAGPGITPGGDFSKLKPGSTTQSIHGKKLIVGPDGRLYTPEQLKATFYKGPLAGLFDTISLKSAFAAGGQLQKYQQLQLDALKAARTKTLSDDLRVAQEIEAIFAHRVETTKLTGKKLYDLKTKFEQAQNDVANIQDQIAADRLNAIQDRTRKAKDAASKEQHALQQQVDLLKFQLSSPIDQEISRLEKQLTGIQTRTERADLRDRLMKAKKALEDAQRSVQIIGAVTPRQRKEIDAYLRPFRSDVRDAQAAQQEFTISSRIRGLKTREDTLLAPLNRVARIGENQTTLLREIRDALLRERRGQKPVPAKSSAQIPGHGAAQDAHTLATSAPHF